MRHTRKSSKLLIAVGIFLAVVIPVGALVANHFSRDSSAASWTVDSISPTSGQAVGGETLVINGSGLPMSKVDFAYTDTAQTFTAPVTGTYRFEAWGAAGGTYGTALGGLGGYSQGEINLTAGETIYVYVGQAGNTDKSATNYTVPPTFNGGGQGGIDLDLGAAGSGGGATDFRLVDGNWDDLSSLRSRIMVAGGGGGGESAVTNPKGGYAGGLAGSAGDGGSGGSGNGGGGGGTQTTGGVANGTGATAGQFGIGGNGGYILPSNSTRVFGAGGGGGYYGGGAGGQGQSVRKAGGGGSSYVSGFTGSVAITSDTDSTPKTGCADGTIDNACSIHYSGRTFSNITMFDGRGVDVESGAKPGIPRPDGNGNFDIANDGDGYARISLTQTPELEITIDGIDCPITRYGESQVLCTTPAHAVGAVDVVVTMGGTSQTFTYTYVQPAITDISPTSGSLNGGDTVKITSTDFTLISKPTAEFSYNGDVQVFTAPETDWYRLELWGASGGCSDNRVECDERVGHGGYATGQIKLQQGETISVYVGGVGGNGNPDFNGWNSYDVNTDQGKITSGGFNDGNNGYGGGATDIRAGGSTSNHRILVAGGGGGSLHSQGEAGYGGGLVGGDGAGNCAPALGGAQTNGLSGGFGYGGYVVGGTGLRASGGGGWYGGGGSDYCGAGGSGFVWATGATVSTSYLADDRYLLQSGETLGGRDVAIPAVDGSTEIGHLGDGYARISSALAVDLGGSPCRVTAISGDEITCTTSAHAEGLVGVTVNNGLESATESNAYTYYGPINITDISPNHGLTDGDTLVTITGSGFLAPQPPMPNTMQEMSQAYCKSMTVGDTLSLPDARDAQVYDVRKLADNNCWMISNLKLGSTTGPTLLTDDDTNLTNKASYTLPQLNDGSDTSQRSDTTPYIYGPSPTADNGSYGYYYNWTAAVAENDSSAIVGDSENAPNSICPSGWRLPRGGNSGVHSPTNDFDILNARMAGFASNLDPDYDDYGNYMYYAAGWISPSQFNRVLAGSWRNPNGFDTSGNQGSYWSSTVNDFPAYANIVYFSPGSASPDSSYNRDNGVTVRCMSDGGTASGSGLSVKFDGIDVAEIVGTPTDTEIVVRTPSHAVAELVDVTVDNGLTGDTVDDGYLYYDALKITSIEPDNGLTTGGTTVTITGTNFNTPTLPKPTTMQNMTQSYCISMPVYPASGSELTIPDTRNGQDYTVRKLQDGKCWMVTNLKLGSTTGTTPLTDQDTDLNTTSNPNITDNAGTLSFTLPQLVTNGSTSYDNPGAYGPVDGDSSGTAGTTNSNNAINDDTFYGYLYNWSAATAGETTTSINSTSGTVAPNSICPKGWRLPQGGYIGDPTNDFDILNAKMAGYADNQSQYQSDFDYGQTFSDNWLPTGSFRGVFSGGWYSGFGDQGDGGSFWSSSVGSSGSAFGLYFGDGSVLPNDYYSRRYGFGVRCVVDAGESLSVTFDGVPATIVSHTDKKIVVTTPAHVADEVDVVVSNVLSSDTVDDGYEYIAPYIKISSDKPSALVLVNPTTTGAVATDHLTLTTETNYPEGFTLKITQGASGTNLTCSTGLATGTTLPVTSDSVTTLDLNTWGFGIGTISTEPSTWRAVSSSSITLDSLGTAGSTTTHLYYGARLGYGMPACPDYTGAVIVMAGVVV